MYTGYFKGSLQSPDKVNCFHIASMSLKEICSVVRLVFTDTYYSEH